MLEPEKKTTDIGSMIGIIVVLVVLLVGAFYFAEQRIQKQKEFQAVLNQVEISSTSTFPNEMPGIENNINSTDINSTATGTNNI